MSIVVTLYPANATKEELLGLLLAEKFTKTIYFLDPFPKGSLYYKWFETKEYRSIDGMEAVIFPVSVKPDKKKPKPLWGLFTRTRVWASAYDQQKQNEVIRKARKAFGGYFDNDAAGRNRYIKLSDSDYMTPSESGIFQVYERVKSQLDTLKFAIKDHEEKIIIPQNAHKDIIRLMKDIRPSLALYNSLLPFLVAVVEHYFRELFTVLIEYDPYARDRIRELKLNTLKEFNTVADAMQIQEGSLKVEVLIAKGYNFQNIEMVNSCYNKFLRIDIKKILSAKKRIGSRNVQMLEQLQELIERRHWMIHHFDFSTDIDKEKYLYYLSFTNYLIDMLTMEIEKLKGYNILSHSTYSNTTGQF